jgi:hypothetical protein
LDMWSIYALLLSDNWIDEHKCDCQHINFVYIF